MKSVKAKRWLLPLWAFLAVLVLLAVPGSRAAARETFDMTIPDAHDGGFDFGEEVKVKITTQFFAYAYVSGLQINGAWNWILVDVQKDGQEQEFWQLRYGAGSYPAMGTPMYVTFTPKEPGTYTVRAAWHGYLGDVSKIYSPDHTITFKVTRAKVSKINITGIHNLAPGTSYPLQAEVLPENAYNKTLKWTSSNTRVATVNQKGVVKVSSSAGGKSVNIVAAATDGSGKKKTWKIKVPKKKVKSISISRPKTTAYPGEEVQLTASVSPAKNTVASVTWSVDHPEWCEVTAEGMIAPYTAGAGKKVRVTAAAADGSGVKKIVTIKIGDALQAFTTDLVKGKIQVSSCGETKWPKITVPITVGDRLVFLQGASASISKITYTSSNGKVLSVSNKTGSATAKKAGSAKVKITVTKTNKKKVTATLKFQVEEPCKYPYQDDSSNTRLGLIVNGKELQTGHDILKFPEETEDNWAYGPVEDILKALGVQYVKNTDGSRIGGTLNGKVFYIKEGNARMVIDGGGHLYGYGDDDQHSTPLMYEDVLYAPVNFFDCFAEGAMVRSDGQYVSLDLQVDKANSGAYGITTAELMDD